MVPKWRGWIWPCCLLEGFLLAHIFFWLSFFSSLWVWWGMAFPLACWLFFWFIKDFSLVGSWSPFFPFLFVWSSKEAEFPSYILFPFFFFYLFPLRPIAMVGQDVMNPFQKQRMGSKLKELSWNWGRSCGSMREPTSSDWSESGVILYILSLFILGFILTLPPQKSCMLEVAVPFALNGVVQNFKLPRRKFDMRCLFVKAYQSKWHETEDKFSM